MEHLKRKQLLCVHEWKRRQYCMDGDGPEAVILKVPEVLTEEANLFYGQSRTYI